MRIESLSTRARSNGLKVTTQIYNFSYSTTPYSLSKPRASTSNSKSIERYILLNGSRFPWWTTLIFEIFSLSLLNCYSYRQPLKTLVIQQVDLGRALSSINAIRSVLAKRACTHSHPCHLTNLIPKAASLSHLFIWGGKVMSSHSGPLLISVERSGSIVS